MLPHRRVYDEEHNQLRETVRRFAASKIAPDFQRWEEAGIVDRSLWSAGGTAGLLCPQVPEEFGGAGGDFRHNAVVIEVSQVRPPTSPCTTTCAVDTCSAMERLSKRKNGCREWCRAKPFAPSR